MSSAQAIAAGQGDITKMDRLPSIPQTPVQTKHPVFYPLVLSLVWAWNPHFPANINVAVGVSAFFACWALIASYFLLRNLGTGIGLALGIVAFCGLHPLFLRHAHQDALDRFKNLYEKKFSKAVECLEKDRKVLLAFYDFPAEHWGHLRTTNPIESTFATVRLRQRRTKGCGSREASLTMVFMLARQAERHWRRLNGSEVIVHVLDGKEFKDGLMVQENAA